MLVDDHELFRCGLRRRLDGEPGLQVVSAASRGDEAVACVARLQPDVVVLDVDPTGSGAIELYAIRDASPATAVLMLTQSAVDDEILHALLAGAVGCLRKEAPLSKIVAAIRTAAAGHAMLPPRVAADLLARLRRRTGEPTPPADTDLSDRERDVLTLLAAGRDNIEIGRELHLSASTVKRDVADVLEKLGVENRIQAAVLAVRRGLLEGERRRGG